MQRRLLPITVLSAVVGAVAAVAVIEGLDLDNRSTTTVEQQAPLTGGSVNAGDNEGPTLTAGDIYKRDAAGVVYIRAQIVQRTSSPFDFGLQTEQQGVATGSGFVIGKDGTILTNAHVVSGATHVSVQFADKQRVAAKVLGKDASTDLALLKVDPSGLKLTLLNLGTSRTVEVGDPAIAIGNPFGLERTLTTGVISAVKRTITAPNNFQIDDAIQTDAPINPGNSGGPLIDATGKVIGINSQIATSGNGGGSIGIGFAVPIDTAKQIIPQLKKSGRVDRGFLGVIARPIDPALKDTLNLPTGRGALVQSVTPGGPGDKAGIRAGDITAQLDGEPIQLGGDIITKVGDKDVRADGDLDAAVADSKPGSHVTITLIRQGKTKTVDVTLGERPGQAPAAGGP
jgi:S1-C subfamily serine protease